MVALEAMKEPAGKRRTGKQGKVYVAQVSAEHGDIIKQITDQLTNDTEMVEQSDFVLVANQKNKTKKPLLET